MPPVARPHKRPYAVLRRRSSYKARRYGTRWQVGEHAQTNAATAGAALWMAEFLDVDRN